MRRWVTAALMGALLGLGGAHLAEGATPRREGRYEAQRGDREDEASEKTREDRRDACCKHCRRGKPCGDTCISRNKVCHVGPGCAC